MTSTLNPAGQNQAEVSEFPMARAAGGPFDPPADLICNQDFRLIRSREGSACALVFLDRTKAPPGAGAAGRSAATGPRRRRTGLEGARNEERGS
jgi:hypothetical protein